MGGGQAVRYYYGSGEAPHTHTPQWLPEALAGGWREALGWGSLSPFISTPLISEQERNGVGVRRGRTIFLFPTQIEVGAAGKNRV